MTISIEYKEFAQWDYSEQKRLLRDHIPVRDARKRELQVKCGGVHCFRPATGYRAVSLGLMQCLHCGMRTNDPILIRDAVTVSDRARIDEFRAFMSWNNDIARELLSEHIVERRARLAVVQNNCDHDYRSAYNPKTRRRDSVCIKCKHSKPKGDKHGT